MGKYSEETLRLKAKLTKEQWAALSEEERLAIRQKQAASAKRMWAARTEAEKREIGRKISEAKKKASSAGS